MSEAKMSGDSTKLHPTVMWAQRTDKIYLTINLEDCKNPTIELGEQKLIFRGKGGAENKEYEAELEFLHEINPNESKYVVLARNIPFVIKKKEEGPYWNKLSKIKVHWVKTDFNKWRDEDDSDVDETQDMAFEDMMKQMGNFNTTDQPPTQEAEGEEEEDSDDEELPDLQ